MRKINVIKPIVPNLPIRKRVAAYARVSANVGERPMQSLSAQVSHYSAFIQKYSEWEYAGVYADLGQTGTTGGRDEYQRLLADCIDGKIDIILTKSISRFARNTVELLETVRRLKDIGVEVRFEREGISSTSGDGELMLSILASFAQEESRSISENMKWRIRKDFKEGKPRSMRIYGYCYKKGVCEIVPKEAEAIRLVFDNYLKGISPEDTAEYLNNNGYKSYTGKPFVGNVLRAILRNIRYTGVLVLQKTFTVDHITHKKKVNEGELPMYFVEDAHPAIISKEVFQAVQDEITRRRSLGIFANTGIKTSVLTSKIKCGKCGASFHRQTEIRNHRYDFHAWKCATQSRKGFLKCNIKKIPETILKDICTEVLGLTEFDDATFAERVREIYIPEDDLMVFRFHDGTEFEKRWERLNPAYKGVWTDEMRLAASVRKKKQHTEAKKNES